MQFHYGRSVAAALCALIAVLAAMPEASARCREDRIERFLESRFFSLPTERMIKRYSDRLFRYYDDRDISRRAVLRKMQDWDERWPDRIYKFLAIRDFEFASDYDACSVTFDYKYIAYSYERDKLSAGVGRTTLVLADVDYDDRMRIIAEYGKVLCRGMRAFKRNRC